jgi:hypothetical protein
VGGEWCFGHGARGSGGRGEGGRPGPAAPVDLPNTGGPATFTSPMVAPAPAQSLWPLSVGQRPTRGRTDTRRPKDTRAPVPRDGPLQAQEPFFFVCFDAYRFCCFCCSDQRVSRDKSTSDGTAWRQREVRRPVCGSPAPTASPRSSLVGKRPGSTSTGTQVAIAKNKKKPHNPRHIKTMKHHLPGRPAAHRPWGAAQRCRYGCPLLYQATFEWWLWVDGGTFVRSWSSPAVVAGERGWMPMQELSRARPAPPLAGTVRGVVVLFGMVFCVGVVLVFVVAWGGLGLAPGPVCWLWRGPGWGCWGGQLPPPPGWVGWGGWGRSRGGAWAVRWPEVGATVWGQGRAKVSMAD